MKKCIFCLIFSVFFLILSGCSRVVVTSADELLMTNRYAQTASGIKAELLFYDETAEFNIIFPDETKPVSIKGTVAVDDKKFYITSSELGKTYAFSYKVSGHKAEIIYNGESLDFYPYEEESKAY